MRSQAFAYTHFLWAGHTSHEVHSPKMHSTGRYKQEAYYDERVSLPQLQTIEKNGCSSERSNLPTRTLAVQNFATR